MDTITNTVWQRKGSSIIFDKKSLGPFIADGSVISLRQALSWYKNLPPSPPVPGRTILVSGLETVIETREPQEAEDFLCNRIRPLVIFLQNRWTDYGLVFGFTSHPKTFEVSSLNEEVMFRRRNRKLVHLSDTIWGGTASVSMKQVNREDEQSGEEVTIGYYVARVS